MDNDVSICIYSYNNLSEVQLNNSMYFLRICIIFTLKI